MKSHKTVTLGASMLVLAGLLAVIGTTASDAVAGGPDDGARARNGAVYATAAGQALDKGNIAGGVASAEAAVSAQPRNAAYRALLGQAYLRAGRFASARDALADALSLAPNDGHSALAFALAQIASGDWNGARATLDTHADVIAVADRGLAVALAGDPGAAIELLTAAARTPGADAKTRQNLALALALAGRWPESRSVAELDLGPAEVEKRMTQWASFAHPSGAADQVASLLGVTPVVDQGQPVALALNARVAPVAAEAAPAPKVAETSAPQVAAAAQPPVAALEPAPVVEVASAPAMPREAAPVMLETHPVPLAKTEPAPMVARAAGSKPGHPHVRRPVLAIAATVPAAPAKGNFYLQLGAYDSEGVAHDGWKRALRRYPALAAHAPSGMAFKMADASYYRLSVGGFQRADAVAMCVAYRAHGGNCFVREGAGDQAAAWLAPKEQAVATKPTKPAPGTKPAAKPALPAKPASAKPAPKRK